MGKRTPKGRKHQKDHHRRNKRSKSNKRKHPHETSPKWDKVGDNMFEVIKEYYQDGLYNNIKGDPMYVGNFVSAGWITEAQYTEITGEPYME